MDWLLFRLRLTPLRQYGLFEDRDRGPILLDIIQGKPTFEGSREVQWHIGNVDTSNQPWTYFAFGKLAVDEQPQIDPVTGDFVDEQVERAPYTHVVLDVSTGLLAIAHNPALTYHPRAAAGNLRKLLENETRVRDVGYDIELDPIKEPNEFINALLSAYTIKKFTITFKRPNPIDMHADFHGPMSRIAAETEAREGQTTLKGESLDADTLVQMTRSAAATGDGASARLQPEPGRRLVTRSLEANQARVNVDSEAVSTDKPRLFEALISKFDRIRGRREE